jgi:hypothetical protein
VDGILYWTARSGLVALWIAACVLAWRRGARGTAGLAAVYASLRVQSWNFDLLNLGRAGLRELGVYDQRIVPKIILAVILTALVTWVLWRRVRTAPSGRRSATWPAFLALLLQGLLLISETVSLDDFLPRWLMTQPGRYLFEGTMAAVALAGIRPREEAGR